MFQNRIALFLLDDVEHNSTSHTDVLLQAEKEKLKALEKAKADKGAEGGAKDKKEKKEKK
jgi:hypothetical protein